jgi:hypothetical protein
LLVVAEDPHPNGYVDYTRTGPALDGQAFTHTTESTPFAWWSAPAAVPDTFPWCVVILYGNTVCYEESTFAAVPPMARTRCVR